MGVVNTLRKRVNDNWERAYTYGLVVGVGGAILGAVVLDPVLSMGWFVGMLLGIVAGGFVAGYSTDHQMDRTVIRPGEFDTVDDGELVRARFFPGLAVGIYAVIPLQLLIVGAAVLTVLEYEGPLSFVVFLTMMGIALVILLSVVLTAGILAGSFGSITGSYLSTGGTVGPDSDRAEEFETSAENGSTVEEGSTGGASGGTSAVEEGSTDGASGGTSAVEEGSTDGASGGTSDVAPVFLENHRKLDTADGDDTRAVLRSVDLDAETGPLDGGTIDLDIGNYERADYYELSTAVSLNAVAIGLGSDVITYEPDAFPGLVYHHTDDAAGDAVLFQTGEALLFTRSDDDQEAFREAVEAKLTELGLADG